LHKISESLDLERFAEDKRIQAHKAQRHLLVMSLTAASSDLANVQTQLASVNSNIAQTEATLDNTNQRLENLNEARGDRHAQCEEAATDYMNGRASR
jgi:predicted  nucleic acid-binding Zn-ribbon protein